MKDEIPQMRVTICQSLKILIQILYVQTQVCHLEAPRAIFLIESCTCLHAAFYDRM